MTQYLTRVFVAHIVPTNDVEIVAAAAVTVETFLVHYKLEGNMRRARRRQPAASVAVATTRSPRPFLQETRTHDAVRHDMALPPMNFAADLAVATTSLALALAFLVRKKKVYAALRHEIVSHISEELEMDYHWSKLWASSVSEDNRLRNSHDRLPPLPNHAPIGYTCY